ncbi:hypothetical protein ACDT10_24410 [Mycobacterium intracellulare]|uniref:hypothetical protein n=1 Tax=Mycobacterium intracellulare TaxID=1767 RepID=UPI003557C209
MTDNETLTTYGVTELTVHRRGTRIALTLPGVPTLDLDKVEPVGRIELGREQTGKMNYLAIDRATGALVRGYVLNDREPESPDLDEIVRNAWLTIRELPIITDVFIGTDKDL